MSILFFRWQSLNHVMDTYAKKTPKEAARDIFDNWCCKFVVGKQAFISWMAPTLELFVSYKKLDFHPVLFTWMRNCNPLSMKESIEYYIDPKVWPHRSVEKSVVPVNFRFCNSFPSWIGFTLEFPDGNMIIWKLSKSIIYLFIKLVHYKIIFIVIVNCI